MDLLTNINVPTGYGIREWLVLERFGFSTDKFWDRASDSVCWNILSEYFKKEITRLVQITRE